jgi:hypothetical protein
MFPLLGVLFLDHLLELVRFLAQLREGLLYRIGFLSAFLSGVDIGFFCSVFLKTTAITIIVLRVCAPMLLAKVTVFLGTSFLRDSGTVVSTRLLRTHLLLCKAFSLQEATVILDLSWPHFLLCEAFLSREALDLLDISWPHARSIASRDRRSERISTGVPPFL